RTHAPKATDRTPGMCSESTVSPLDRTVRRSPTSSFVAKALTPGCDLRHVRDGVVCADDLLCCGSTFRCRRRPELPQRVRCRHFVLRSGMARHLLLRQALERAPSST